MFRWIYGGAKVKHLLNSPQPSIPARSGMPFGMGLASVGRNSYTPPVGVSGNTNCFNHMIKAGLGSVRVSRYCERVIIRIR